MVSLTKTPLTEGGDDLQANVDPRFWAGLPFPVPEAHTICDSVIRANLPKFSPDFPEISLDTPEEIKGAHKGRGATTRFKERFLEGSRDCFQEGSKKGS